MICAEKHGRRAGAKDIMPLLIYVFVLVFGRRMPNSKDPIAAGRNWSEEERDHYRFERRVSTFNAVAASIAAIATCAAAVFAYNAYIEAKRQANVAQRALEVSLRPWVYLENLEVPASIVMLGDEVFLTLQARVKNYSQIPANSLMLSTKLVLNDMDTADIKAYSKEYCHVFRDFSFDSGGIVSGGDSSKTNFTAASIKIPEKMGQDQFGLGHGLAAISCLNYNGPDGSVHQVIGVHQLFDADSKSFEDFAIKLRNGIVAKEKVQMFLMFMFDAGEGRRG
jgi:hypothetical protein